MIGPDSDDQKTDLVSLLGTTKKSSNKNRRSTRILLIIGIVITVVLVVIFSIWNPFWRFQSGYVSAAQFGEDWPFTVSEARVVCAGSGEMLLQTRAGTFALTSRVQAIGYLGINDSNIWKYDSNGWQNRVPAEKFWLYINTLCK